MAQNLNIVVCTTTAQFPWSNGLNERHNGVLEEMVMKTLEDAQCNFEVALSWAVNAKNTIHMAIALTNWFFEKILTCLPF